MPHFIAFTAPDGSLVQVNADVVLRVRRAIDGEDLSKGARTRIDYGLMQLVQEAPDAVAALVRQHLGSFVPVTAPDGSPIWINARKAAGPVPLTPAMLDQTRRSALRIMGYRQYVRETPDEVRALLEAHGGEILS